MPTTPHEDRIKEIAGQLEKIDAIYKVQRVGVRTTMCLITLANGQEYGGFSCTQTPENFDDTIGHRYALEDACSNIGKGSFWIGNTLNS